MIASSDSPKPAAPASWVDARAPGPLRPWLHLARAGGPIGYWLLMWPCWWSVALAGGGLLHVDLFVLFLIGAIVMRAAGCVINDILDRDIDAQVERTRTRPLASGAVTLRGALIYLALLLLLGLAVLLQLNKAAIIIGAASLGLVALYPLMKRLTYWPQLFLGLTFNWGALVGWTAMEGSLSLAPLMLYAGCICWTIGYDTIYAHQDKADDIKIGVKSTALRFGNRTKPIVSVFYVLFVVGLVAAGIETDRAWYYYPFLLVILAQLNWQVRTVILDDPNSCKQRFASNGQIGIYYFLVLLVT
ncbi:MAG: 4-hydroxybenzoate octaprenyltransferase [Rhodospirillales bacterium]|nr:4-hydroxybenzoate octaprenyltransferase [Rhodospirillales bacterium]